MRSRWVAAAFLAAGVAFASVRELAAIASLKEAVRAALAASVYRSTRLAALLVVAGVARWPPRTPGQLVALVLAWSGAWDLAGAFWGSPWDRWGVARPLAGVTWAVVGAILVGCGSRR